MAEQTESAGFVHLHCHSQYSLLDGASQIENIIEAARSDRQPAVALTDHGNLFGAVEFYLKAGKLNEKAAENGLPPVKPIIGMEAYITPFGRDRFWKDASASSSRRRTGDEDGLKEQGSFHLILLAENFEGYKNLVKLASKAYLEGFYRRPRIDHQLLAHHSTGLIMTSTDIGGEIAQAILRGGLKKGREAAGRYMEIIGPENFYFEIQDHSGGRPLDVAFVEKHHELTRMEKEVNEVTLKLAEEFGRPVLATNDSHYMKREDAEAHDILLCIATGKTFDDSNRLRFPSDDFYLKTAMEMHAVFDRYGVNAVENTMLVAERCNVEIETTIGKKGTDGYHMPNYKVPGGEDSTVFFRRITYEGLKKRYGDPLSEKVVERAEEELGHIIRMGFVGYMLLVYDIVSTAREMDIPVGPGRGSAVGSVVTYALGITNIDPLPYDLLFERFINPGRNQMPDIDIDFCQARRQELIDRLVEKYGRENVANIITFGKLGPKLAIRDTCRVLDIPLSIAGKWAKMIPDGPKQKLKKVMDSDSEVQKLYKEDEQFRRVWNIAVKLEGTVRNSGVHAAGMVLADKPIIEYSALYKDPKTKTVTTQNHKKMIGPIGLLKVDMLGLQTLTALRTTLDLVYTRHGLRIPLDEIPRGSVSEYEALPPEEQHPAFPAEKMRRTYDMLTSGDSKGLFQLESDGMRRLLQQTQPERLEDLIALNAMYRPGPMAWIPSYIARRHGREPVSYPHPVLEPILRDTYGRIIYQEQVMRIANVLAGFNLSESDKLRKAISDKDRAAMDKYYDKFIDGAGRLHGVSKNKAVELWETIAQFAEYGFNKSHSTAYAFLALQTAYLKANYSAEFMSAQITLDQNSDKVFRLIDEARSMGLNVLPPCINESDVGFAPTSDKTIRFGLGAIKGCGRKAMEEVVATRGKGGKFRDLFDFCERVNLRIVNKTAVESLVKAGAFDFCCPNRRRLLKSVSKALSRGQAYSRDTAAGLVSLFGEQAETEDFEHLLPKMEPWTTRETALNEKEALGFYLTADPLGEHRRIIEKLSTADSGKLAEILHDMPITIGGLVTKVRTILTRTSKKKMAFLTVEDSKGSCEVTLFPVVYEENRKLAVEDTPVIVAGKVDRYRDENKPSVIAEKLVAVPDAFRELPIDVRFILNETDFSLEHLNGFAKIIAEYPGNSRIYILLRTGFLGEIRMVLGESYSVSPCPAFEAAIAGLFGTADILDYCIDSTRLHGMFKSRPRYNGNGRYNGASGSSSRMAAQPRRALG